MRLLIPLAAASPVAIEPPPAWVEPLEVPVVALPQGPVRPSVQYLLVDDQVQLEGGLARYADLAFRIVSPAGLDELSRLEVSFHPAYEELVLHEVMIHRDGVWHDRLERAELQVIQPEFELHQHIVDGSRMLVVVLPDVRVGDVLRYRYTIEGHNPVFGDELGLGFDLAWGVPAGLRRVRLLFDPADPPWVKAHGLAVMPEQSPGELSLTLTNLPALQGEPLTPLDVDPFPWLQVSTWADWSEVTDWALALYELPAEQDAAEALAAELRATHPSDSTFVTAATSWVQDEVRYWGAEIGTGSHRPRTPDQVIERRWGDCKDKSLLLATLLRSQGVEAWPALVSSSERSGVSRWHPSALAFDHVIAAIELDGELLFVDPTRNLQGGGITERWLPRFGEALLIREGEGALRPVRAVPMGELRTVRRYDLGAEPATRVEEIAWGGSWADVQRAENHDAAAPDMGGVPAGDDVHGVQDDRKANVLTRRRAGEHPGYTWDAETGQDWFGAESLEQVQALPLVSAPRVFPLALQLGYRAIEGIEIAAPDLTGFPQPSVDLDTPWFRWRQTSELADGVLIVEHELEVLADRVEPEDLDAYLAAAQQVHAASVYWAERPRSLLERLDAGELARALLALLAAVGGGYVLGRRGRSAASR